MDKLFLKKTVGPGGNSLKRFNQKIIEHRCIISLFLLPATSPVIPSEKVVVR